jgi:hypothetical protein
MVGNIYLVGGPQVISGIVTATGFSGSGANLTSLPSGQLTGALPAISGASLTNVDATTLDGVDSSSFLRSNTDDTFTGQLRLDKEATINTTTPGLTATYGLHFGGQSTADSATGITFSAGNAAQTNANAGIYVQGSGSYGTKMYIATTDSYSSGSKTAISIDHSGVVNFVRSTPTSGGNAIWHAGNDGSGSGLDADTLDGVQGASFLRSDADDTYTGNLTFNGFLAPTGTNVARNLRLRGGTSASTDAGISLYNGSNSWVMQLYGESSTPSYGFLGSNWGSWDMRKTVNGQLVLTVGGVTATAWHSANDGAGSGLDADTLDGVQGSGYMGLTGSYWNANNWISFNSSHGLYWPNNYSYHVYLYNQYLYIRNNNTSNGIIVATNNGTTRGYFYADSSNQIGLLNNAGSWGFKMDSSGNCTATGNVTAYSDARIKENVRTVDNALEKVKSMRGVYFDRKDTGKASVGVIAQEIEEILPEVVETTDTRTKENPDALEDLKTVSYGNIVGVLIEAIKDQQKQIDELKAKLEEK